MNVKGRKNYAETYWLMKVKYYMALQRKSTKRKYTYTWFGTERGKC